MPSPEPDRLFSETLPEFRPPANRKRSSAKRANPPPAGSLPLPNGSREECQTAFLRALSGPKRYKRFIGSPLRYGGGKSRFLWPCAIVNIGGIGITMLDKGGKLSAWEPAPAVC